MYDESDVQDEKRLRYERDHLVKVRQYCVPCKEHYTLEVWDHNSEPPEGTDPLETHDFHLRVVCAWCKRPMKSKPCLEENDGKISDGMCEDCGSKFADEMEKV